MAISKLLTSEKIKMIKDELENELVVSFLGSVRTGKTVHCALIKDAAVNHLRTATDNKYYGIVTKGNNRINSIIDKLYAGIFPSATLLDDAIKITVQINSTVSAESVDIALRDMSGEKYRDLVESELPEDEIEKRLNEIVKLGKSQKASYGNMSHLIFAHIYVILIDCTNDDWESKQNYVADAIQNIYKFKKTINQTMYNKFHAPIALIFTKYDTLPTEKQLSIDELFKKLPVIQNALTKYHAQGMFKYFKSNISSRKLTNEEATERIQDHITNNPKINQLNFKYKDLIAEKDNCKQAINNAKSILIEHEKTLKYAKTMLSSGNLRIQEKISSSQEKINGVENDLNEMEEEYHDISKEISEIKKNIKIEQGKLSNNKHTLESLKINPDSVVKPLSYNHDDYTDLILWFIEMNQKIKGK